MKGLMEKFSGTLDGKNSYREVIEEMPKYDWWTISGERGPRLVKIIENCKNADTGDKTKSEELKKVGTKQKIKSKVNKAKDECIIW